MNEYEYSPVEILRLQTATQLTTTFINKSRQLTQEEVEEIIKDAFIATEYLLEGCKTKPDRRIRVPEGNNITFDSMDTTFYYESRSEGLPSYTNQDGTKVRKKLGE